LFNFQPQNKWRRVCPKCATQCQLRTQMASGLEATVDDDLTKLEKHAQKHLIEEASNFVAKQSKEIDFLAMVEGMENHLHGVMVNEDRSQLVAIFGYPYTRIYRIRYLLDTVPLSERRVTDRRWVQLRKLADVVESILRDLDGAKFKPWQEVKDFQPPFQSLDDSPVGEVLAEAAKEEPEETPPPAADEDEPVWCVENSFELGNKESEYVVDGAKAPLLPKDQVQSVTTAVSMLNEGTLSCDADFCVVFSSSKEKYFVLYKRGAKLVASLALQEEPDTATSLHFAEFPRGPHAYFRCENLALSRNSECGFWAKIVDNAAGVAGALGVQERTTKAAVSKARESFSKVPDDGGTAISKLPVKRFPGVGQYAEVVVTGVTDSLLGCCGIGFTTSPPRSFDMANPFPDRLEFFNKESWIFSGPYRGITQRLYINGKKESPFFPDENHKRFKAGDRLGVLLLPDARISLYRNRQPMVTFTARGLEDVNIMEKDLYLVVEVYGYVTTVFLDNDATPEGLPIKDGATES